MKLTNEEIAKVFAMYWGCECTHTGVASIVDDIVLTDLRNHEYGIGWFKLLLTPLSAISDEDAKLIANICKIWGNISIERGIDYIRIANEYNDKVTLYTLGTFSNPTIIDRHGTIAAEYAIPIFQYLVSQGYAVPLFFGIDHPYNGKTAIELGIAIDKTTLNEATA